MLQENLAFSSFGKCYQEPAGGSEVSAVLLGPGRAATEAEAEGKSSRKAPADQERGTGWDESDGSG